MRPFCKQSTQSSCFCEQGEPTILECKSHFIVCTENQLPFTRGEVCPATHQVNRWQHRYYYIFTPLSLAWGINFLALIISDMLCSQTWLVMACYPRDSVLGRMYNASRSEQYKKVVVPHDLQEQPTQKISFQYMPWSSQEMTNSTMNLM